MSHLPLGQSRDIMLELRDIRNQYSALVPPRLIAFPPATALASLESQTYLLSNLLGESRFPQPEDGYRRLFWRMILRYLELGLETAHAEKGRDEGHMVEDEEDDDLEIDERFYDLMSSLMVNPACTNDMVTDPQQSHRTFIYAPSSSKSILGSSNHHTPAYSEGVERYITLLEEQTVLQGGTTGLRTWTAALHLGHHLLHRPSILNLPDPAISENSKRKGILELGAGTGFLSCLLAQQGYRVVSTDLGDVIGGGIPPLERLEHNVKLNGLGAAIRISALDWMDAARDSSERPQIWGQLQRDPPATIVAADVIYDPDLIPPLVHTLSTLLVRNHISSSPTMPQAIIAATVRNPETIAIFANECERLGLVVEEVELPPVDVSRPTFWDSGLDVSVPVRIMRIIPRM